MTTTTVYRELLDALDRYLLDHADPQLPRFRPAMQGWGESCRAVEPATLPVARYLETDLGDCHEQGRALLQTFARHNDHLYWEQSYRRQDGLVPDAMLDGYGFVELVGLRGPFVSDRIRAGIAAWGPGIDYPMHRHQAEEAYILLGGSAEFRLEGAPDELRRGGDVVYVAPHRWHGFRTLDQRVLLCYLWQAGDLREISKFAG